MRNFIYLVCVAVVLSASGCGSMTETKGNVSEKAFAMKVDNPQVNEFNKQLGEISSEASAEKVVNGFVNYVDSRLDKSAFGKSVQSVGALIGPDVIKKMAKQEAAIRNGGGIGVYSEGGTVAPLIDVGTVTDNINTLGSSEGVRVNDETVTTAKTAVEGSIPNINTDNKSGMTPLEASVIAYAIVSGDDGTATAESITLPEDKVNSYADKVNNFVENITN